MAAVVALICFSGTISSSAQTTPATTPNITFSMAGGVTAIAFLADGKMIIGGWFSSVSGVPRPSLARLNADGSVDATWTPAFGGHVVAVSDTHVFAAVDSEPNHQRLIKISLSGTGEADASWNPLIPELSSVFSMAMAGDDLFIHAQFSYPGFATQRLFKVKTTGTGAVDLSWGGELTGSVFSFLVDGTKIYLGTGDGVHRRYISGGGVDGTWTPKLTDGAVYSLAMIGTDLFVGGGFSRIDEQSPLDIFKNGLAKVSTQGRGAIDHSWNPSVSGYVQALTVADDHLYLGGSSITTVGGQAREGLARVSLSGTGAVDTAWSPVVSSVVGARTQVRALVVRDEAVYVGGEFSSVNGRLAPSVAKLGLAEGLPDESFPAQALYPAEVRALGLQSDGQIIAGGNFVIVDGLQRQGLVRITTDGSVDTTWNPNTDGEVNELIVNGQSLYVSGTFQNIGGRARNGLAKLDLAGGDRADATWNPNAKNGSVRLLAATSSHVYVGGGFTQIGGLNRTNFSRLSALGAGGADPNWDPKPMTLRYVGPNETYEVPGFVNAVAVSGSSVFLSGGFVRIGGVSRVGLAKLEAFGNGAVDPLWTPPGSTDIDALAVSGTNLFVGDSSRIRKLSILGTGAVDASWTPLTGSCRVDVSRFGISGTNLYVAGLFYGTGCLWGDRVVKIDGTGTGEIDPSWGFGYDRYVGDYQSILSLAVRGSYIYCGGSFSVVGGVARQGLAFLPVAEAPVVHGDRSELFLSKNPANLRGVSHFLIKSINGGSLYHSDGVMPIHAGDFITVSQAQAGLKFEGNPDGTFTVVSAVNDTPAGAGSATTTVDLSLPLLPALRFAKASYAINERSGVMEVAVRKIGNGAANVSFTTIHGTATAGSDYIHKSGTLNFGVLETNKTIVIDIVTDHVDEGDEVFSIVQTGATDGAGLVHPSTATIKIVENEFLNNPRLLADGFFQMTLLGETGRLYTIQWSQTLSNWSELMTLTNLTGLTNLIDRQATNSPQRFYRVLER